MKNITRARMVAMAIRDEATMYRRIDRKLAREAADLLDELTGLLAQCSESNTGEPVVTDAMVEAVHGFELMDDDGLIITWDLAEEVARSVIVAAQENNDENA